MEVIILAGGLGTRLRSEVRDVPKCMASVSGKPFLWYMLKYLMRFEVERVVLSVGYLRETISDWIPTVKDEFPFILDYAEEEIPLGTGGGIRLALSQCTCRDVVVLNGDTFFDVDLTEMMKQHRLLPSAVTLALKPMKDFDRYGQVIIDKGDKQIKKFCEKQYCDDGLINGGIYAINRDRIDMSGLPKKFSFETEILTPQCKQGHLYGIVQDGYFIDIGIPEDYHRADREFSELFKQRMK